MLLPAEDGGNSWIVARQRLGFLVALMQSDGEDSGEDSLSASMPPKSDAVKELPSSPAEAARPLDNRNSKCE